MTLPTPNPDSAPSPQRRRQRGGSLGRSIGLGALVIAVVVGIQLGRLPWRYRRQILQLQGFVAGVLVGYLAGRISQGSRQGENDHGDGPGKRLP